MCVFGSVCIYTHICMYKSVCMSFVYAFGMRKERRERNPDRVR